MTKFWYFLLDLTSQKPDLIFSSGTMMTIMVIFIKIRINLIPQAGVDLTLFSLNVLLMLEMFLYEYFLFSTPYFSNPWTHTSCYKGKLSIWSLPLSNSHPLVLCFQTQPCKESIMCFLPWKPFKTQNYQIILCFLQTKYVY